MSIRQINVVALGALVSLLGCHGSGPASSIDLGGLGDLSSNTDAASPPGADLATSGVPCAGNAAYCSAWNERAYCVLAAGGPVFMKETCAQGCFQGACAATQCADECTLGVSNNLGTCKLWDMVSQSYVTPDQTKLLDRAREHGRVTQEITAPALGAMINPHYTDASHVTLEYFRGTGDAAIWSGSYLAAQSWRVLATGSRDAVDQVAAKVQMLHDWFKVTGDVGYVARLAVPRAAAVPLEYNWQGQDYCQNGIHCNVDFKGAKWDWVGNLSRDQYTGVMLGLGMAYLASPDEAIRELARQDVTTVALELAKSRTFAVAVTVDGLPVSKTITLENVILAPSEYQNGKPTININTSNLSSSDETNMFGIREFLPDLSVMVKQIIPLLTVPFPRPSTAIMLGGFFNIALMASKDVPGYETTYATLKTYYDAHASGWLDLAETWTYTGSCNAKYYPNHITYIMAFMWAALEQDPVNKPRIVDKVLDMAMWQALKDHKNSYFDYLWAGTRSMSPDPTVVMNANNQLAGFLNAPKGFPARDNLASYPQDASCQVGGFPASTIAVDVKDRNIDDFIWQRGAWQLEAAGDPDQLFPATDYLAAYWVARRYNLISDDRPSTCNRYAP
ncbi:MAG: hypothetical protein ABI321_21110 [Polyangia bacterium]